MLGSVIISGRFWRQTIVTVLAAGCFASLYEVTALDSKYAARQAVLRESTALPAPGARLAFSATAYCKGLTTVSGVAVQAGIVAADPELLPVGSVVEIDSSLPNTTGFTRSSIPALPSRGGRSTCICGAAMRRSPSAGDRSTST